MNSPILYSFRRCPYAIRARLALASSRVEVELREILLRDKATAFLKASPSQTVPTLVLSDAVIDESYDIMHWALAQHDPEHWLDEPDAGRELVSYADGPFKLALDRTKYASRYPDHSMSDNRDKASAFLYRLDEQLAQNGYLFGLQPRLSDMAILPFVRQFAFINKAWFDDQAWPHLKKWLENFLGSDLFLSVMDKYPKWEEGDDKTRFPRTKISQPSTN